MRTIRLNSSPWTLNENKPLGEEGGFGAVFQGTSESGELVAIKRLHPHANEYAGRELHVAERLASRNFENILPVLDYGQDAQSDDYFIVMPLAAQSLQEAIQHRGPLSIPDAVEVMAAICSGLIEVSDLVHRDLKPGNILHHDGRWKIADFGIAKFVEDATSTQTLRDFLSAPYAAPEQWLLQRPTTATDVYALGCILYALVTGDPPFVGATRDEYRDKHLNAPPPPLTSAPPRLRGLAAMCLRKAPEARPSLERIFAQLTDAQRDQSLAASPLADVGARLAEEAARAEAAAVLERQKQEGRQLLALEAVAVAESLMQQFAERVKADAPTASLLPGRVGLGQALLSWNIGADVIPESAFEESHWDVVCGGTLTLTQNTHHEYKGRSSSLWYARMPKLKDYRWYEVPYMWIGRGGYNDQLAPVALTSINDADLAASPVFHSFQLAARPLAIDDENFELFYQRWIQRLALAAEGRLTRPRQLPE